MLILGMAVSAAAQFNTNSKMVGASSSLNIGLFSEKDDVSGEKTSLYSFDLTPKAAYFIRNRIALGGELSFAASSSKLEGSDPVSSTNWYLGPFGRYYYKTVSWFVPYGEAGVGIGKEITKITDYLGEPITYKHNVFYFRAGVGASLFLADNFALEGMLAYQFKKSKNPEGGGSHSTSGAVIGFGFVFYFNSLLQDTDGVR